MGRQDVNIPSKPVEIILGVAIVLGFLGLLLFGQRYVLSGPSFVAVLGYKSLEIPGLIISTLLLFGGAILHGYLLTLDEPEPVEAPGS